jgi:predicted enzyme related to lactoylglutathione lyase
MAGKLVHFEIAAADDGRALDFYKQVFGWEFQDSGNRFGLFLSDESVAPPA